MCTIELSYQRLPTGSLPSDGWHFDIPSTYVPITFYGETQKRRLVVKVEYCWVILIQKSCDWWGIRISIWTADFFGKQVSSGIANLKLIKFTDNGFVLNMNLFLDLNFNLTNRAWHFFIKHFNFFIFDFSFNQGLTFGFVLEFKD